MNSYPPLEPLRQPPLSAAEREELEARVVAAIPQFNGKNLTELGKHLAAVAADFYAKRPLPDFEEAERVRVLWLMRRSAVDIVKYMRAAGAWPWQAHQAIQEFDDLVTMRIPVGTHTASGRKFREPGLIMPAGTVLRPGARDPLPAFAFEDLPDDGKPKPKLGEPAASTDGVPPGFVKEEFF